MRCVPDSKRADIAVAILWQTAQALNYLETVQVAHRDIKPENLLVVNRCMHDGKEHVTVKLCDFGWAVWFRPGNRRFTLCGTAEYCPPEMIFDRPYLTEYIDRWMYGVLAYELIHNVSPFADPVSCADLDNDLIFNRVKRFQSLNSKQDSTCNDFVSCFMNVDPAVRLSAEQGLQNKFFESNGYNAKKVRVTRGPSVDQLCQIFQE
jgi:serine/threonine protein kinase